MKEVHEEVIAGLRTTLGKMEVALGRISQGIAWTDRQGNLQWCNAAFCKILNITRVKVLGQRLQDLLTLDMEGSAPFTDTAHPVNRLLTTGEDFSGIYTIPGRDIQVKLSGTTVEETETVSFAMFTLLDITALRDAEQFRLQGAGLQASVTAVLITDINGAVSWSNPAFERLTGYSQEEVQGRSLRLLKSDKNPSEIYADLWSTILKGDVWDGRLVNRRKDGSLYKEHQTITPVSNRDGVVTHFIAVKQDVTELERAESALRLAKEMAEQASDDKSAFLAGVSHEIRTPLNAIIGTSDLLADSSLSSAQQKFVKVLQTSSNVLLGLVDNILDLSKVESAKLELESVSFWLDMLLTELREMMSDACSRKNLQLDIEIAPQMPRCFRGDPGRLRQVLMNLVGNAVKFTERGRVAVRVCIDTDAPAHSLGKVWVVLAVEDTGLGISESQHGQLFRSCIQADSSITRRYGGTGLGLTISRQLVQLMGGTLDVQSAPGQGSTFTMRIPLEPRSGITTQEMAMVPQARDLPAARVLLVDDSEDNRMIVRAYLKDAPLDFVCAEDGQQAVDRFTADTFDLVLMDLQMPVMDGLTATRSMRALEATSGRPHIPIVALTADALKEGAQRCLDAGCDGHFAKPVRKAALVQMLAKYLAPKPVAKQEEGVVVVTDPDAAELMPGYLKNRRLDLQQMVDALEQHDLERIRLLGHSMKGSGGSYGLDQISEIGEALESAATTGDTDTISRQMDQLRDFLERVRVK